MSITWCSLIVVSITLSISSRVECVKQGETHDSNIPLQMHLKDVGLYKGELDGDWGGTSISGVATTWALQTLLEKRGYFIDNRGRAAIVDGDFGPVTCACLQKFLLNRGYLEEHALSGKMDPMTCRAVDNFVNDQDCMYGAVGKSYTGSTAMTDTGKPCSNWTLFTYPAKDFPDATLEDAGNYCRNPDWNTKGPWCRSSDFGGWQTCAIPSCKMSPVCEEGMFTSVLLEEYARTEGMNLGDVLKTKEGIYTHLYECEEDCKKEQKQNWPCQLVEFNPVKKSCVLAAFSIPKDTKNHKNKEDFYKCYIPLPQEMHDNGATSSTVTSKVVLLVVIRVITLLITL